MINVLYQFDDKYAPFAGVSIQSLLENNKEHDLTVYLAGMEVSGKNRERIENMIETNGKKYVWLDVSEAVSIIESLHVGKWNGSYATWIKMFVIHKLQESVDKILYLDCDTIVAGDLGTVYDTGLKDCPLACAYDSLAQGIAKRIGLKAYYNAGVILFNVPKWREEGFFEKMLTHLKAHVSEYPDNEQRLINDYFRDRVGLLPVKGNLQCTHFAFDDDRYFKVFAPDPYYGREEIKEAREAPVVCHFFRFLGDYPWETKNLHPMGDLYLKWKERSPWEKDPLLDKKRKPLFLIERLLYRILPETLFLRIFKFAQENG